MPPRRAAPAAERPLSRRSCEGGEEEELGNVIPPVVMVVFAPGVPFDIAEAVYRELPSVSSCDEDASRWVG